MNLEKTRHCQLCDNLKQDFNFGTKCGLTDEKPNFLNKCDKIKFGDILEERILEINIEKKIFDKKKVNLLGSFFLYLLISLTVGFVAFFVTKKIFEAGYVSTITIVLYGVVLFIFSYGMNFLYQFVTTRKVIQKKVRILHDTLDKYNLDYTTEINISEVHGKLEIDSSVKVATVVHKI